MTDDSSKDFCTIDHANTQKELAQLASYQFWLDQVKTKGEACHGSDEGGEVADRPRRPVARP